MRAGLLIKDNSAWVTVGRIADLRSLISDDAHSPIIDFVLFEWDEKHIDKLQNEQESRDFRVYLTMHPHNDIIHPFNARFAGIDIATTEEREELKLMLYIESYGEPTRWIE